MDPQPEHVPADEASLNAYNSTFAEEDAWNVRILDLAMAMMPDHNNWEIWNSKATELALASLSRPSDNAATTAASASMPTTSCPADARQAAVTVPRCHKPRTATFIHASRAPTRWPADNRVS